MSGALSGMSDSNCSRLSASKWLACDRMGSRIGRVIPGRRQFDVDGGGRVGRDEVHAVGADRPEHQADELGQIARLQCLSRDQERRHTDTHVSRLEGVPDDGKPVLVDAGPTDQSGVTHDQRGWLVLAAHTQQAGRADGRHVPALTHVGASVRRRAAGGRERRAAVQAAFDDARAVTGHLVEAVHQKDRGECHVRTRRDAFDLLDELGGVVATRGQVGVRVRDKVLLGGSRSRADVLQPHGVERLYSSLSCSPCARPRSAASPRQATIGSSPIRLLRC